MIGAVVTNAADYAMGNRMSADNTKVYCLHKEILPVYGQPMTPSSRVYWNERPMWTNSASIYFRGYHSLAANAANRIYAGTEMNFPASALAACNPTNWTMEAMVRAEYLPDFLGSDAKYGALIFGKFGNSSAPHSTPTQFPRYSWMLSLMPSGHLKILWAVDDGNAHTDSSSNYGGRTTAEALLADRRWHHIALTYDADARRFALYVDYVKVLEPALDYPLHDGPFPYFFSRIDIASGFEGWMDEIRFTGRVLVPSQFETFCPLSGMAILFR